MINQLKKFVAATAFTLAVTVAGTSSTPALGAALTVTNPGTNLFSYNASLGWRFRAETNLTVTHLGVFDAGGDGLNGSAEVAIYTTFGQLVASAIIPSGTGGVLDGFYRYQSIAAPILSAGQEYVIGAIAPSDTVARLGPGQGATWSFNSAVTFLHGRFNDNNSVVYPFLGEAFPDLENDFYAGPNFLFTVAGDSGVPAPGALALLGLGLLGFGAARRRLN